MADAYIPRFKSLYDDTIIAAMTEKFGYKNAMRLPKRGFNNIFAKDYAEVNLGAIQKLVDAKTLDAGALIDHEALKAAGVARGGKDGVRILGKGEFSAKLSFKVAGVSAGAKAAIEKAGGSVEVIEVVAAADKAKAKHRTVQKARAADKEAKKAAAKA